MSLVWIVLLVLLAVAAPVRADYEYVEPTSFTKEDFRYVFFISDTSRNWHMAKKDCSVRGLKLASIMSTDENELLKNAISQRVVDNFWISLTDFGSTGSWYWDSNGGPLAFSNWRLTEPNNLGTEQCVEIRAADRDWNNINCNNLRKYVCEGFLPRQ